MSIRLLIVDNDDLSRLTFRIYLEDLPDLATIDEARTTTDALKILKDEAIGLVIAKDRGNGSLSSISNAVKEQSSSDTRLIALVNQENLPHIACDAISGWCLQSIGPVELYSAVAYVMDGFTWIDPALVQALLQKRGSGLLATLNAIASKIEPRRICEVFALSQTEFNAKVKKELSSIQERTGTERAESNTKTAPGQRQVETVQFKPQLKEVLAGRFELQELLEQGGMADVYKAWDSTRQSPAAVKFLNSDTSRDRSFSKRLAQEAEVLRLLSHPNIVRFLGSGVTADGQPYIAMSFVEGVSLESVLQEDGSLSLPQAVPLFIQICDALAHAHSLGIIHRDLTPHNVLLSDEKQSKVVKLIDFGLSKWMPRLERSKQRLTRSGVVCGTPTYMSPEQCTGSKEIDHRSDIYSLGCLLYEVTTGVPPFIGKSVMDTMRMHVHEEPQKLSAVEPDLPEAFCKIAMQCLRKDPAERIQSAEQVKLLLSVVELPAPKKENNSG